MNKERDNGKNKRNKYIGLLTLIVGYTTLSLLMVDIFLSGPGPGIDVRIHNYIMGSFWLFLLPLSVVLIIISLVFNIRESRSNHHISRGLIFALISFPPIGFYFFVAAAKIISEMI